MAKYYDITRLASKGALYRIAFSGRSDGKTYQVLMLAYDMYLKTGKQLAILRRWGTDFDGPQGAGTCFNSLMCDGEQVNQIDRMSHGKYQGVLYSGGRYYLAKTDENGTLVRTSDVIAIGFSLSKSEHYKMASFPDIGMILFDEFIATGDRYLNNEFQMFNSVISTILRSRDGVPIYMMANTLNVRGCIYFREFRIPQVKNMKKGAIDLYTIGETTFAVEYIDSTGEEKKKRSEKYFSYTDKNAMTVSGDWEVPMVPHLDKKYSPKDVIQTFFIETHDDLLHCEFIDMNASVILFVHPKTTLIKNPDTDIIYSYRYDTRKNWHRTLDDGTKLSTTIKKFLAQADKIYFADNETGAAFFQFVMQKNKITS